MRKEGRHHGGPSPDFPSVKPPSGKKWLLEDSKTSSSTYFSLTSLSPVTPWSEVPAGHAPKPQVGNLTSLD